MAKPVRLTNTPIKMAIKLYVSAFKKKNQVLPIPENENEPELTEKPNKRAAIKTSTVQIKAVIQPINNFTWVN